MPELRWKSRIEYAFGLALSFLAYFLSYEKKKIRYIKKREPQKLKELEDELRDEEYLFGDVKLTDEERREILRKKELFELAKQRVSGDDGVERYQFPEAYEDEQGRIDSQKKKALLTTARYDNKQEVVTDEQQEWEADRVPLPIALPTAPPLLVLTPAYIRCGTQQ